MASFEEKMDVLECQVCGLFFSEDVSLRSHIESHSKTELYQCILSLKQVLIQSGINTKSTVIEDHHLNTTNVIDDHHVNTTDTDGITVIGETIAPEVDKTHDHDQSSEKVIAIKQEHFEDYSLYSGIQRMENEDDISLQQTLTKEPDITVRENWTPKAPDVPPESREVVEQPQPATPDNLTCEICNKKLTTWYTLKRHMMSHNSKKQEFCPVCGKGFLGKQNLVVHMRIHTGEKPYKCSYCGKQFTQYGTLYRHKQIHITRGHKEHPQFSQTEAAAPNTTGDDKPENEIYPNQVPGQEEDSSVIVDGISETMTQDDTHTQDNVIIEHSLSNEDLGHVIIDGHVGEEVQIPASDFTQVSQESEIISEEIPIENQHIDETSEVITADVVSEHTVVTDTESQDSQVEEFIPSNTVGEEQIQEVTTETEVVTESVVEHNPEVTNVHEMVVQSEPAEQDVQPYQDHPPPQIEQDVLQIQENCQEHQSEYIPHPQDLQTSMTPDGPQELPRPEHTAPAIQRPEHNRMAMSGMTTIAEVASKLIEQQIAEEMAAASAGAEQAQTGTANYEESSTIQKPPDIPPSQEVHENHQSVPQLPVASEDQRMQANQNLFPFHPSMMGGTSPEVAAQFLESFYRAQAWNPYFFHDPNVLQQKMSIEAHLQSNPLTLEYLRAIEANAKMAAAQQTSVPPPAEPPQTVSKEPEPFKDVDHQGSSQPPKLQSFSSLTESLLRKRNLSPGVETTEPQSSTHYSTAPLSIPQITPSHQIASSTTTQDTQSPVAHSSTSSNPYASMSYPAHVDYDKPRDLSTYISKIGGQQQPSSENAENFCKICQIKFESSAELDKHLAQHMEKNLVWCNICHCKFTTPFSLRRHMKIHTGERDEQCNVCGKKFIDKPRLVVHMRSHTGFKPYKCTICLRTFSRKDALRKHVKIHGDDIDVDSMSPRRGRRSKIKEEEMKYETAVAEATMLQQMYMTLDEKNNPSVSVTSPFKQEQAKVDQDPPTEPPPPYPSVQTPSTSTPSTPIPSTPVPSTPILSTEVQDDPSPSARNESHTSISDREVEESISGITSQNTPEAAENSQTESESPKQIDRDMSLSDSSDSRSINEVNELLMKNFTSKIDGPKPFRCDVCCRSYTMQSCLRRHMLIHTGLKPNKCDVCGKSFVEKQQLAVHYRIHTGERPHKCPVCYKRFTQYGTLHNHMQVHKKNQYKEFNYKQNSELNGEKEEDLSFNLADEKEKSDDGTSPSYADYSMAAASNALNYSHQLPMMHSEKLDETKENDNHEPKSDHHVAQALNIPYVRNPKADLPIDDHSSEPTPDPPSTADGREDKDLSLEMESSSKDTDIEKAVQERLSQLKAEPPIMIPDFYPFYNSLYGLPAAGLMPLNLLANTSEVHQSLMEYMAQLQRARLMSMPDYTSTTQSMPSSSHPVATPESETTPENTNGLNLTVTSDKSNKPQEIPCEICGMKFADQTSLHSHMLIHISAHNTSAASATSPSRASTFSGSIGNNKAHECKTCGKTFSASFCLRRHEMIHSGNKPYKCDFCPKAFVEKQHLACHRRIHTGERPFTCKFCNKSFTQYGTLHKHLRTHTKDKKYKCHLCEKAYYERRQLTNHMLTHFDQSKAAEVQH
ncbi:hypothetical protein FSP39_021823 [Pinctada imbricata]|uniref:C2H2-type domain-containing protein n=1 Tax=Pinctada imbricata TaxID=66713 RepID=A0AA88Y180_PINIB|nr:hypothetical protein FSP39_021823 [Pinctada imbricata]